MPSNSASPNSYVVQPDAAVDRAIDDRAIDDRPIDEQAVVMPDVARPSARKIPLRLVLIVPFALQIAAVGIVGFLSLRNGQGAVNNLASQLETEVSTRILQDLQHEVAIPQIINQNNADAISAGLLDVRNLDDMRKYFWKQIHAFDSISYIQFGSEQKDFLGIERLPDKFQVDLNSKSTDYQYSTYATDNQGNLGERLKQSGSYDPRSRPWYTAAATARKPTWSKVYAYFASPKLAITAVQPVYAADGDLVGVLGNDLTLSQLNDALRQTKIGNSGLTFIMERSGELIASSSREQPFVISKDGKQVNRLKASDSTEPLIRSTSQYLTQQYSNLSTINASTQLKFDFNGQRHFLQVTPFKDGRGIDWLIAVVVPEADFTAQINANTRTTIVLCLAALAVAIAVGVITTNAITKPITQLRQASQAIASGELEQQVSVPGVGELDELAQSFNQMANQLRDSITELETTNSTLETTNRELEQRVEQQTAELRQAKEAADSAREASEQAKITIQRRALQLLQEVDPVRQGNLTVRAEVTVDEIGTIADFYNATVASLRKIVRQVQDAANQVAAATSNNEISVQALSAGALQQAQEIAAALAQVEEMAEVVRAVAESAKHAETLVEQTAQTVEEGGMAMNRTVEGIQTIRTTVAETAKKVKHLGESSQKISTVVELISAFAAQTNMLALNASIEAARAGEEGRGFAVVADEVRALAQQSAAATEEIKKLVASIQTETNEVIMAMESGTVQVVTGTTLVDETRYSLTKITNATVQMSQLVEAIAHATVVQAQVSDTMTQTIKNVADIANKTSTEANQVSSSFEQLRDVADALQAGIGQFTVS